MSDAPDPTPGRPSAGRWLAWLVAAVVVALALLGLRSWGGTGDDEPVAGDTGDVVVADGGDVEPDLPVASVSGQVWLEVQPEPVEPEPAAAVVVVENGQVRVLGEGTGTGGDDDAVGPGADDEGTGADDEDTGDAGQAEAVDEGESDVEPGEVDPGIFAADDDGDGDTPTEPAPEDAPPQYELIAPEPGTCQVVAWQQGKRVGAPTVCADDGSFTLALDPGVSGRTAFEILVPGRLRAVVEVDVPGGGRGRLPAVALGVAETVAGQVVDRDGAPVVGASIEAMPIENLDEPEPWRVTTDAEGHFVLDTLPPGPVGLRARAQGFAVSVAEAIAPQDDVLLVLDRLHQMRGRVAGPADVLARTRVRLEGSGVWPAREVAVDADGTFAFDEVPDGVYALEAIAPADGDGPAFASIPLENVTPDLSASLGLIAAYHVHVTVQDPLAYPLPGARVTLGNAAVGVLQRLATTDEHGQATIGPVVPGPYVVRADAEGYLPAVPVAVTVEDADPEAVTLRLSMPRAIRGRVVDEDGHGVALARIDVEAEELHTVGESEARAKVFAVAAAGTGSLGVTTGPVPPIPRADEEDEDGSIAAPRSDQDGYFVVQMLPPGRYRLSASHPDFAHGSEQQVQVKAGTDVEGVLLVLRRGERLTGRVRDGNGRPIDGARVRVDDDTFFTDRKGEFDAGPRQGRVRIVARAAGLAPATETVLVRNRPVDVELVLRPADAELTGRVEGENGEVLADARVTLHMLDGLSATEVRWTDDKGVYLFEHIAPGRAEIEVDHPDHAPHTQTVDVTRARDRVDIRLARGWSIDIEVRIEGTKDPVAGARITAGDARARTDADGRATISRLTDDVVTVVAEADGFGQASARVPRPDAGDAELRLSIREGGGLAGLVTDYRGDPVAGATVIVRDLDGNEVGRARTGADGRWKIGGVAEGDLEVEATPPADRDEELAPTALSTDVLRGHVTRGVDLRFDRL